VPIRGRDMKKKPANPLMKFVPSENTRPEISEPSVRPRPPKTTTYDEIPIKSNYTENMTASNFDLNAIKENQSINIGNGPKTLNFEDRPIQGVREHQLESYFQEEKDERVKNSSLNMDMDERPLTGGGKDFKELLREKLPGAIAMEEEEDARDERDERKAETRHFLKRGSRQHLSSAINRSKQPKNNGDSLNKSEISDQRSVTPRKNAP
jgi:hypothetical protein